MKKAVFAGSFDPFTIGHLDVLRRAAALFDEVHVGVLVNPEKRPVFTPEERRAMIEAAVYGAGIDAVFCAVRGACSFEQIRKSCKQDMEMLTDAVLRTLMLGGQGR